MIPFSRLYNCCFAVAECLARCCPCLSDNLFETTSENGDPSEPSTRPPTPRPREEDKPNSGESAVTIDERIPLASPPPPPPLPVSAPLQLELPASHAAQPMSPRPSTPMAARLPAQLSHKWTRSSSLIKERYQPY